MDTNQYSEHISNIYASGVIMMNMAIGQNIGLFQLLCDTDSPLTSQEIAERTNQKERYVREWLNGMVAARIVQLDNESKQYYLTDGQKKALSLMSGFAPYLLIFAGRAPGVIECFSNEGPHGFQYEDHPKIFDWFDSYWDGMHIDHALDTEILPFFNTQGLTSKLETGISIMDLGCGTGGNVFGLAQRFPKSNFTGVEYSHRALEIANKRKQDEGLSNIDFQFGDAHNLPETWTDKFDMVFMYDVLHDLPDPLKALSEVYRVLKPSGYLGLVEMNFHSNPVDNVGNMTAAMYYGVSSFVCLPCSMSAEPRVGYGPCWGVENIEKALRDSKFSILDKVNSYIVIQTKVFYACSKA